MRERGRQHRVDVQREAARRVERDLAHAAIVKARRDGVDAVRRGRDQDLLAARRRERAHQQVDALVGSARDDDALGGHAVIARGLTDQRGGLRGRIAVEAVQLGLRGQHARRLVGVEEDLAPAG